MRAKPGWFIGICGCLAFVSAIAATSTAPTGRQVTTTDGVVEGTMGASGSVRVFRGIPFAEAPIGALRWQPPQPVEHWTGTRKAVAYGAHCMQAGIFPGTVFADGGESEDCLFVNLWTPAKAANQKLPVIVWVHGGGFVDGASSEPRYDGENLAKKGAVVVTFNYRLGIFGFFAHPELTAESGRGASGDYGLLDQVAALRWVAANVAAFGGDPDNVTIAGESAGSLCISALMASPPAQGLFHKAIGESGAFFNDSETGGIPTQTQAEIEAAGAKFAKAIGAPTLADLRARPAADLSRASLKASFPSTVSIDGYVLPARVDELYARGAQAHVPLLAGWNADEGKFMIVGAKQKLTAGGFKLLATIRFGFQTGAFLTLYPAATDEEANTSAEQLAGDDFTAYSTWKWLNLQARSEAPVYRYFFEQIPANAPGAMVGTLPASALGSMHAGEIEYVFQTLKWHDVPLTPGDLRLADTMSSYWVNFAKNGDPNGPGLPTWPRYAAAGGYPVMHLAGNSSHAAPEDNRARYEFLDAQAPKAK
jgi:para-nitrobenzyl esterase